MVFQNSINSLWYQKFLTDFPRCLCSDRPIAFHVENRNRSCRNHCNKTDNCQKHHTSAGGVLFTCMFWIFWIFVLSPPYNLLYPIQSLFPHVTPIWNLMHGAFDTIGTPYIRVVCHGNIEQKNYQTVKITATIPLKTIDTAFDIGLYGLSDYASGRCPRWYTHSMPCIQSF